MSLIKSEYKINGFDDLIINISIFIFLLLIINFNPAVKNYLMIVFFEICVPIITAIKCSNLIEDKNNIEIIMTCKTSIKKIITFKFVITLGAIVLVGLFEIAIFVILYRSISFLTLLLALIPTTLVLSTISLLLSILGKSIGVGTSLTGILWLIQIGVGRKLSVSIYEHPWYEIISFYNTLFKYNSSLWLASKLNLFFISVLLYVIIIVLLNKPEKILI